MSSLLYLVRHGIAEELGPQIDDAERALTPEGRRRMKEIARGLRQLGAAPTLVLTSPLRRAQETAEILRAGVAPDARLALFPPLDNAHRPEDIVARMPHAKQREIALVGHQPSLGQLASYLLTGSPGLVPLAFKKGGVAAISVHAMPPRSPGALEWFLTPRQLRSISSPD
jgi:phosphohistidine phosphatase